MEFLQQIFGSLTSGIVRLGVAVGIIVAVGIFIVKPVLDTTEKTVENTNKTFEKSFEGTGVDVKAIEEQINKSVEDVNNQVQVQVEHSVHIAKAQGGMRKTQKLLHCIQRAHQNVHRIERCSRRYS